MGKICKFRLARALRAGLTAVVATGARKGRSRSRKARPPMAQAGQQGGWRGERATGSSARLPGPQLQAADSLEKPKIRQLGSLSHHLSSSQPTFFWPYSKSALVQPGLRPIVSYGFRKPTAPSGQALRLLHCHRQAAGAALAPLQHLCSQQILHNHTNKDSRAIYWQSSPGVVA